MVNLAAAQEAIEWAESCGLVLDESQCIALRAGMGERAPDHKWAAFEVAHIGPRQSVGKNDTVAAREGYEMFVAGSALAIHTAHESKTADESFRRMEELINESSEMRAQVVRFRYGNGDHAVEFKSGARLLYKTRTGGGARGFAGASLLVYDEALFLQAKHVAASLAVLARGRTVAHNPQVWALSSAALSTSDYLHDVRRRAFAGNGGVMRTDAPGSGGRLAVVEHTAERLWLDVRGRVCTNRGQVDLDDRGLWALANPSMNHPEHGVSEEFIEAEKRFQSSDPDGWARERLGFFDPAPEDALALDSKITADLWALTGIPAVTVLARFPKMLTAAFAVDIDGVSGSIAVAAGSLQSPFVEHTLLRTGVGWLPDEVVAILLSDPSVSVGYVANGPAGAQAGPILAAMADAKLDANRLVPVGSIDYRNACGGFYTDVTELVDGRPRLMRPVFVKGSGSGQLEDAVGNAAEHVVNGTFRWEPRNVTVPISPLVACTIARALLPVTVPVLVSAGYYGVSEDYEEV